MEASEVPFVPWREFLPTFMEAWPENAKAEHVTLVGPTGQGKTKLALALMKERARLRGSHSVVFGTKPKDKTLSSLKWPIIREWPPGYGQEQVIFWPRYGEPETAEQRQRKAFAPALADIFERGARVVYFDEASYFANDLNLEGMMKRYWQMGRSQRLIVVAGTQRPRQVPRQMFSECSWFIAFRTADDDELKRVAEIGGADTRMIRDVMRTLEPHEFLVVRTRTGQMVRSRWSRHGPATERGTADTSEGAGGHDRGATAQREVSRR